MTSRTPANFCSTLSPRTAVYARPSLLTEAPALDVASLLKRVNYNGAVAYDARFPVSKLSASHSRDLQPRFEGTLRSPQGFQIVPSHLDDLQDVMREDKGIHKAIIVQPMLDEDDNEIFIVLDGNHRVNASINLKRTTIEAVILPISTPLDVSMSVTAAANDILNGKRSARADQTYFIIKMAKDHGMSPKQIAKVLPNVSVQRASNVVRQLLADARLGREGLTNYPGIRSLSLDTQRTLATIPDDVVYRNAVCLAADAGMTFDDAKTMAAEIRGKSRTAAVNALNKRRTALVHTIAQRGASGGKSTRKTKGIQALQRALLAVQNANQTITANGVASALTSPAELAMAAQAIADCQKDLRKLNNAIQSQVKMYSAANTGSRSGRPAAKAGKK